jgi:hypothetical protein
MSADRTPRCSRSRGFEIDEWTNSYPTRDQRGRTEIILGDLTADERVRRRNEADLGLPRRPSQRCPGARPRRRPRGRPCLRRPRSTRGCWAQPPRRVHGRARCAQGNGVPHRAYAGRDPELRAILAELEAELDRFDKPMLEMSLKMAYGNRPGAGRGRGRCRADSRHPARGRGQQASPGENGRPWPASPAPSRLGVR